MAKTSRMRVDAQFTCREFLRLAQAPTAGTGTSGGNQAASDSAVFAS